MGNVIQDLRLFRTRKIAQLQGLLWSGGYAFIVSLVLGLIIHKTMGLTVDPNAEDRGLDVVEHGESAYHLT